MTSSFRKLFVHLTILLLLVGCLAVAPASASNEQQIDALLTDSPPDLFAGLDDSADALARDAKSPHPAELGGERWWAEVQQQLTKSTPAADTAIPQPDGLSWGPVATADVNGDGFADIILGVGNVPCSRCGRIYVFHGSASGVSTTASSMIEETTNKRFASGVYRAGDVNGDSYDDVVVTQKNNQTTAYVFHGSASGLPSGNAVTVASSTLPPIQRSIPLGDINGDFYDDLAIQVQYRPLCGCQEVAVSRIYIYHGSASGLTTSGRTQIDYPDIASMCNCTKIGGFTCSTRVCGFGDGITAGDFDNDGNTDLALVASNYEKNGRVYIYGGTGGAFATTPDQTFDVPAGERPNTAAAGDFDGDSFADLAIGSGRHNSIRILEGSSAGLTGTTTTTLTGPSDASGDSGGFPGKAIADDLDNDGLDDLMVSATNFDLTTATRAGRLYFYNGSASGLPTTATSFFEGTATNERLGGRVASADVNGDLTNDLVLLNLGNLGQALVYHGSGGSSASLEAGFGADVTPGPIPLTVHFTSTSTATDTTITSWAWDFDGDGTIDSIDESPSYTYTAEGLFSVTLTVSDGSISSILTQDELIEANAQLAGGGLDEGSGTTVSFGPGLDGDLVGGVTWGDGQQGSSLEFDGSGYAEFVDTGADWPLDLQDALSLALWIRPDDLGGTQVLMSKDDAYELEIGKLGETTWDIRFNNQVEGQGSSAIVEGLWQHLVVTWDGSTVRYYYNGQPDGSDAFAGPLNTNDTSVGLGARPTPPAFGGPSFFFLGAMDDVRIFQRALSNAEVVDLFASTVNDITPPTLSGGSPLGPLPAGTTSATLGITSDESSTCRFDLYDEASSYGEMANTFSTTGGTSHAEPLGGLSDDTIHRYDVRCRDTLGNANTFSTEIAFTVGDSDILAGLAAFWTLDENGGCAALDATTQHDGALGPDCAGDNTPAWTPGINGSGLAFDGGDDEVRVTGSAALNAPSALTLGAWIQHGATDWAAILEKRDAGEDGYNLYISNTGQLVMRINAIKVSSAETVTDGQWHHVAGTYDGNAVRLYIDGEEATFQAIGAQTLDTTADLLLGRNFSSTAFSFSGTMDEVTIHDRALSNIEVFDLFGSTLP